LKTILAPLSWILHIYPRHEKSGVRIPQIVPAK
jgi:hypothetical protein